MEQTKTDDDSITFYSEEFEEFYHSKSGALEEAFLKFAQPSKIVDVKKTKINILDVCFGLGYNSLAGIIEALKNPNIKEINITAIELDSKIMQQTKNINLEYKEYEIIKKAIEEALNNNNNNNNNTLNENKHNNIKSIKTFSTTQNNKTINIKIYIEDARSVVKQLKSKLLENKKFKNEENNSKNDFLFDYVFHDPFSPKKCPILWTEELFTDIYSIMNKEGILTTYSCARVTRENLSLAGFMIEDGPKVWRRGPSTIAIKK